MSSTKFFFQNLKYRNISRENDDIPNGSFNRPQNIELTNDAN